MDVIDPDRVDWSAVRGATYRIDQALAYEYESPILDLHHRLVISPRAAHGDQRRLNYRLWTSVGIPCATGVDRFGNSVAELAAKRIERGITFSLEATVLRSSYTAPHTVAAAEVNFPAWLRMRRMIRADGALAEVARELSARFRNERERAEAIVQYVHQTLIYTKGVTDVFTTASVAYSMRRGVCQDFAHVTIAIARASGLHARYVSGHLIGEGATHAWVEILVREVDDRCAVYAYDPTRGRPTSLRYVTIAVGRDYEDVAPTSGVFVGESSGKLTGTQSVSLLEIEAA
jgi:transglutaminase-like putative cysteine protease